VNPERWKRLKEIFEKALEKDADSRPAFLEETCREDSSLKAEVEALLQNHAQDSFLEKPLYEAVPELFESHATSMLIGSNLGPYAIFSKIGRGGMGIVYLGRDTRLDRPVAIKMLAPKYTSDPQQRERLRREARAAAKLSHSGIATVYSLEEFENTLYIVSEYVAGDTLLQLTSEGPLPIPMLLDTAVQIARALKAAHEEGIVHRDLKPENVIRTKSGIIKILDFGLARVDQQGNSEQSPRLTRSGMFLGTPAYASPEQLLGADVDFRTDLFSFGVMVYELAAGSHPFGAVDSMTTIARILEADVAALDRQDANLPEGLEGIIRRCLKKNPAERYGSTQDLIYDLEQLLKKDPLGRTPVKSAAAVPGIQRERGVTPLWWWQFHQACAGFGYYGMLYPLWRVKQWLGGVEGSLLFFPALIAVGVASNLRLHLWFTSRFYPAELSHQRQKVTSWIRGADCLFVFMLTITAVRIHTIHAIIATLLMSVSIGSLVAFSLIEPTTTKAALDTAASPISRDRERLIK
jgi:tRNA A-37 threonylcarbamoyl transferase component Bud32